ncbi:MAG: PHP domain-containing protein [Candidatus Lokiarchaeota archaeon]|nr:PHP domain-containing protein [Candidatus Lokiarchaeota archaeon]
MLTTKFDLHIHTRYSDGISSVKEVINMGIQKKLSLIAITDHFSTSWKQSFIDTINETNFSSYFEEIKRVRKEANYKCMIGIEIDAESNWSDIIMIPYNEFEIILFEYVSTLSFLKQIVEIIEKYEINSLICLAHNFYFQRMDIEKFGNILIENNIFFELNSRYLNQFDEKAIKILKIFKDIGIKFTLGSDAHDIKRIGDVQASVDLLKSIDALDNLINIDQISLTL